MQKQRLFWAAGYLAVVQFLFFTTWIVYIIYLGDLLEQVGIGKDKLLWFILFDQFLFAITDIVMGFAADRAGRLMQRLGPLILGVNTLSCLGFVAMPWLAGMGDPGGMTQALWVTALVLWVATSSVLRSPAFVLLAKHAAQPQVPWLVAVNLTGLALGGAVSPYLGVALKAVDPWVPFLITAVTLWLTTVGLIYIERLIADDANPEPRAAVPVVANPAFRLLLLTLLGGTLLLALGFQLHFFINSKPQYLQFVQPAQLTWLMPVFWIGFNLLVFPGTSLSGKHDPLMVMLLTLPLGVLGLWLAAHEFGLNTLVVAQLLAGGTWGVLLMAGITASLFIGGKAHGGLVLGSWFSMQAVGTLVRVLIVLGEGDKNPAFAAWLEVLPVICWVLGGVCLYLARRFYLQYKPHPAPT
jgi:hypothetical protein